MFELNAITAIPVGIITAFIWLAILMRRLLHISMFRNLTSKRRILLSTCAFIVVLPAALFGFVVSLPISNMVVSPGGASHLALAITVVFSVAVFAVAVPLVVTLFMALAMTHKWKRHRK